MIKKGIYKYIITAGILCSFVACSTFVNFDPNYQEQSNTQKASNSFPSHCRLLSLRTTFEEFNFPLYNKEFSSSGLSPTLSFSDGSCSGFAGCNAIYGGYAVDGNAIKISGFGSTYKNCGTLANHIEKLFQSTLLEVNNFSIQNGDLILRNGSKTLMVFRIEQ